MTTRPSCADLVADAVARRVPLATRRRGTLVLVTDNPAKRSVTRKATP